MKPVVLCILDGWGLSEDKSANAPAIADTPVMDKLFESCPHAKLITHGPDAGLPKGQMGNSEVGHTNIGAGRVVAMDLGQIDLAIEDGSFQKNDKILHFINVLKDSGGTAHVVGILSDGGVHGHIDHTIATLNTLANYEIPVVVHVITDGRDVAPVSALEYLTVLEKHLPPSAIIGTVTGRYFALDRDNRWERVSTAFHAMANGRGPSATSALEAIEAAYENDQTDEFIPATVIDGFGGMSDGDGLFCLNFRADRAREIMSAFAEPGFSAFEAGTRPAFASVLGMVSYSDKHDAFMDVTFPKRDLKNTLGEWVAKHGKTQFRLAETEKYPHVTFFLNGGVETPSSGEERFMPASPKVATYDLQPEMSSQEVTDQFVQAIEAGFDLIVTNYANPDMVGHTGSLDAAIAACSAVDRGLGKVIEAIQKAGGVMIVTADHGNCEMMVDPETGEPHTAHTTNLVPVILVNGPQDATLRDGRLADLAPTLLKLMKLPQPTEMTGKSLF